MRKFYFLILGLLFGGLVFAQGGVQPIRITEMLPHVIPTNTNYGNMTDECADAYSCMSGDKIMGFAFVYHNIDSAFSRNMYLGRIFMGNGGESGEEPLAEIGTEDISLAEEALAEFYNQTFRTKWYRSRYPTISNPKNYDKYLRQYGFYTDSVGDRCVYVKFFFEPDREFFLHLCMEFVSVCDGGNDYWTAFINLSKRKVVQWNANGTA